MSPRKLNCLWSYFNGWPFNNFAHKKLKPFHKLNYSSKQISIILYPYDAPSLERLPGLQWQAHECSSFHGSGHRDEYKIIRKQLLTIRKNMASQFSIQCPPNIYLFKVNNRSTIKRCEICSKLTIKRPERRVFIFNFGHISHLFMVFLLLTLNK